jgi:hypothetical protein
MKKLIAVAAVAAGLVFGGAAGANAAGLKVCANVDVNGQGTGGEQCVETPAAPALPALP